EGDSAPGAEAGSEDDSDADADAITLDGDGVTGDGSGGEVHVGDPEEVAVRAQIAFDAQHWREPAAGSLALELANLGLVDPGHEAIARLRRETADVLEPLAVKALKRKKWDEAVASYRDLFAVWPEYDESARDDFVEALRNLGRASRGQKQHASALAVADELLNVRPDYFYALKLRADS